MIFFHKFHILTCSPWPLFLSLFTWNIFISFLIFFFKKKNFLLFLSLLNLIIFIILWWRDVIYESLLGVHRLEVKTNIKFRIILFIFSEIIFFFGWFWAFFHNRLSPSNDLGTIWPPFYILPIEPFQIPFLNTCVLLRRGLTITLVHHLILINKDSKSFFLFTLFLGFFFTYLQYIEYKNRSFSLRENSYGSSFFITTGFHGLHVLIGSIFIFICLLLTISKKINKLTNLRLEFSIWYWHFVDVVWLFLFIFLYWWAFLLL